MLRVTTIYAGHAGLTADYYGNYLAQAPGEVPGVWVGSQADQLGLTGNVARDHLEALLEARDPVTETPLGQPFNDRTLHDGRVIRAVAAFDATFSAPKSVSVLWALTQDERFLLAHDVAVTAALAHLDRFGSTTRIRKGPSQMLHPDTGGLIIAKFRQTTSRSDDPDLHTHSVISNKVRTTDGRWRALDGAYLKKHQRMLGGIYQSVLRNELSHTFGFEWEPIVNGQAEIAGIPKDVLRAFSKRTVQVEDALDVKIAEFVAREGRDPSTWERAALTREAAGDTRAKKSGNGVADLTTRWTNEAQALGWTGHDLVDAALLAADELRHEQIIDNLTAHEVIDLLSAAGSVWNRADIMKAICDLKRPLASQDGERWAASLERACDVVMEACVGLDPVDTSGPRRESDGRSLTTPPIARHFTSERILAEEDFIISWAIDAQEVEPTPSPTVDVDGLDAMQTEVARAVAGHDRLVLAVGPAGAGKTTTLRAAVADLRRSGRPVFGVAPSAKAARVLERETGLQSDTLAKLLHEWERTDRSPLTQYDLPRGTTVIVDEAGMVGTSALTRLVGLAEDEGWRLVLVGDHRQLQAVGRSGMFHELCLTGRSIELDCIHRFHEPWEAAASLQLRHGDPRGLDAYFDHGRVAAGKFDDHLRHVARTWLDATDMGLTIAITTSTNEHVDKINEVIQYLRTATEEISAAGGRALIGGDEVAYVGDIVVTRQNNRRLTTSIGEPVRNRESWTVEAIRDDGSLTVSSNGGSGTVTLPADYASEHVRLGYAATEHGNQGDTVDVALELATVATTQRGLYVGVTRGRRDNQILVVTDGTDLDSAREILEYVLTNDRADIPATTQRRLLAEIEQPTAPSRPSLTARCEVPTWFADLQSEVARRLAAANAEVDDERTKIEQVCARIEEAKRDLADAEREMAPHRPAIDQARQSLEDARDEARAARRGLERSSRIKRPAARRDVAQADQALDVARDQLDAAQAPAAPIRQRIAGAHATIKNGKSSLSTLHTLHKWSGNETSRSRLVDLDGALGVWHRWAGGHAVDDADVTSAVRVLHASDDAELQPALDYLSGAFVEWAEQTHVTLLPAPEVHPPSLRAGIEIEL